MAPASRPLAVCRLGRVRYARGLELQAEHVAVEALRRVEPIRISATGDAPRRDPCDVVVEELLTIMVEGVGSFALMCTPCDAMALAVGFAFSEGMISSVDDVIQHSERHDPHTIALRLDDPRQVASGRNLIVTSSCGLCGSRNIDKLMAGLAASVGLKSIIFVPERAPQAKVAQLLIFGARVIMVQGTYDQAFDLCLEAAREYPWYSRNTAYNPYLSEGKKTAVQGAVT